MAEHTTRIGIVGIGGIAEMHAMAIGDLPNTQLVGGCYRTEQKGRAFAEKFGCDWYGEGGIPAAGLTLLVILFVVGTPSFIKKERAA